MVAPRGNKIARIPALGIRTLALVALSILLMYLDSRDQHLNAVHDAIDTAMYPLRVIVDAPSRVWTWARDRTVSRDQLRRENENLRDEQLAARARLLRLAALEAENDRLRAMLDARQQVADQVRVAEIMAVDADRFRHTIVLDIGTSDGVYDGQAIVDANGVVGQVIQASLMTADALLISDPGHALPVEVNRNGLRTIAYGTGEFGRLDLPGLANNADIQPGDLLVTSGLGGAFPAGYPVATVDTVIRLPQQPFADVSAAPVAALDQVREVMLVWSTPRTGEVDAEEPGADE